MKVRKEVDERAICEEYLNSKIGIESLALKYHVGKKRIKEILAKNDIKFKKRGAQGNNEALVVSDFKVRKYVNGDDYYFVVKDVNTDFVSKDIDNRGGFLTSYIQKQYGVEIPTLYDRRMYYMRTGDYWWEQFLSYEKIARNVSNKNLFTTKTDKRTQFIQKAMACHRGENLDYSEVVYVNNRTPVKIICHDLKPDGTEYGEFWQTPSNHLKGQTHPLKKGLCISDKKKMKQDEVIRRFKEVHKGEKLDYSEAVYKNMHTKVKIISHDLRPDGTEYGEFWQEPVVHLKGCTHPDIGIAKASTSHLLTTEEYVAKAKLVHGDKYDYSNIEYTNSRGKINVFCHQKNNKGVEHGMFSINADNFLQGKGCPKCGNQISYAEDEIFSLVKNSIEDTIIARDRSVLEGKELDIYIPSYGIAFEYNGLRWHNTQFKPDKNYHLKKQMACKKKGVTLYHIFEDEYIYHKEALFSKIRHILGANGDLMKVAGRKCNIKEIDKNVAYEFLERNHIQGFVASTVYLGAYYNESLVSVMTFLKEHEEGCWNLTRSASNIDVVCQGVTSKLFKYFLRNYEVSRVKTFLDRRWERNVDNNVYTKCGFVFDCFVRPEYRYTNGHGERLHKFGFRKDILHRKYGFPLTMSESEMVKEIGYERIYDCGLVKYIYRK